MRAPVASTGLTITNPLVLYRALLATQKIEPDESQHRLAIHLQKLYHRLKDYEPTLEYARRLERISSALSKPQTSSSPSIVQDDNGPRVSLLSRFQQRKAEAESLALIRSMTSAEAAMQMDSPQGLLLHGEVGTGKSMLIDLLATSLPTGKKRRWHFNAFMLETFARLERVRRDRARSALLSGISAPANEESNSLLVIARDLVEASPILFLDEFQLPDRASAKILSSLFTAFFQLGGVLVATSNRMPEELAKAAGVEFAPAPRSFLGLQSLRSFIGAFSGEERNGRGQARNIFSGNADFAQFLDVLRARCETWDMAGERDWRRREAESSAHSGRSSSVVFSKGSPIMMDVGNDVKEGYSDRLPSLYHIQTASDQLWFADVLFAVSSEHTVPTEPIVWKPRTLNVYSRPLIIAQTHGGIAKCTFSSLCATNLGPADYISIASTFHTLIITEVPVLSLLHKNEARRFITLLDALYEARCRLLIRAEAGPDDIFFPEISGTGTGSFPAMDSKDGPKERTSESFVNASEESVYAESFSDMYQDMTSPFRPNISSYVSPASSPSYPPAPLPANPSILLTQTPKQSNSAGPGQFSAHPSERSVLADEDADFGPVYGAGRSHGASTGSQTDFDIPSKQGEDASRTPNFQHTAQFTGADERFAFARARSRLWEMCGRRWWNDRPLDSVEQWWQPMPFESRAWEGKQPSGAAGDLDGGTREDVLDETAKALKKTEDDEKGSFPHGATSPFRTMMEPPPNIGWQHAWGMVRWGKKAGKWGEGVEGLGRRTEVKQPVERSGTEDEGSGSGKGK